jgi:hypothetical protein
VDAIDLVSLDRHNVVSYYFSPTYRKYGTSILIDWIDLLPQFHPQKNQTINSIARQISRNISELA